MAQDLCRTEEPPLHDTGGGRVSRCHFWQQADDLPRATSAAPVPTVVDQDAAPVVRAEGLRKTFKQDGHEIHAVQDIALALRPGETLGLVGESGSGKTTLARLLLGLTEPDEGSVVELDGHALAGRTAKRDADDVRALQIVFQNPDSALNRRFSIQRIIGRAITKLLGKTGREKDERLAELAESVRFDARLLRARPAELSGGLKQRVAIARAFAGDPRVVVCDEPTSALDVSVQAAILNLLAELQTSKEVAYLFISHDLGVVRYLSDRIAVLYLGQLMELGSAETVFEPGQHPVHGGAAVVRARAPRASERERIRLEGEIPSAANPPSGCVFHTRCPRFLGDKCVNERPPLAEVEPGHLMRCHIPVEELRVAAGPGEAARAVTTTIRAAVLEEARRRRSRCRSWSWRRPGPGEVRVRLYASGVCHSDFNAIDGTAPTRCPACSVTRARASSRPWAPGVRGLAPGARVMLSWMPVLRHAAPSARAAWSTCARARGRAWATAGCSTGRRGCRATASPSTTTRSSPRSPTQTVVPAACCIPIPDDVGFDVAAIAGCAVATGHRRGVAHRGRAAGRPRRRVRLRRGRA